MPVKGKGYELELWTDGKYRNTAGSSGVVENYPAMTESEAKALNNIGHGGTAKIVELPGEVWVDTPEEALNYIQYLADAYQQEQGLT